MQLESLPNELLLNLFELFDTNHLLRAFFGLNARFDNLVYAHIRTHQVNFQFLSKDEFDIISHHHLPLFIDQIVSLRLSNEETPGLCELLLTRGFGLDRFICFKITYIALHSFF